MIGVALIWAVTGVVGAALGVWRFLARDPFAPAPLPRARLLPAKG